MLGANISLMQKYRLCKILFGVKVAWRQERLCRQILHMKGFLCLVLGHGLVLCVCVCLARSCLVFMCGVCVPSGVKIVVMVSCAKAVRV